MIVEVSDDGKTFRSISRLEPPRTRVAGLGCRLYTFNNSNTARFFRFIYDKTGTEPGAEDIDAAKWKPSLKITGIELSVEPRIHQYEGKNGEVWRISKRTTSEQVPNDLCVPFNSIIDITTIP